MLPEYYPKHRKAYKNEDSEITVFLQTCILIPSHRNKQLMQQFQLGLYDSSTFCQTARNTQNNTKTSEEASWICADCGLVWGPEAEDADSPICARCTEGGGDLEWCVGCQAWYHAAPTAECPGWHRP